jgi:Asp-tRNAAsn/Glu-tRNAGln amidotransferase A subunit and related amidases
MTAYIAPLPLAATLEALRSGQQDLIAAVNALCDRIEAIDGELQALLPEPNRRERLLAEARALLERYPNPAERPVLFGAFLAVKDIFHVDGFVTRAGSQLPPELFAGEEAETVRALRAAGALIVGKAVTTEFAYYEPGPTGNPYNLKHTPGGSSSGSAAAVAAGISNLALGSQTVGSVIRPAAFCGVIGYKPSFGRISTHGVVPFSQSADHVGLFTQDVAGLVLACSVLCSAWRSQLAPLSSPVLGVPEGPYLDQMPSEGRAAFEQQIAQLEAAGYVIKRVQAFGDLATIAQRHRRMIAAEIAQVHAEWFKQHEALYRERTAGIIREGQPVTAEALEESRAARFELRQQLHEQMDAEGIDLWVCPPAFGPAPESLQVTGDPAMNMPWTNSGMPALTVPAGKAANGLPLGLQLVARFERDEELLAWAAGIAELCAQL